MMLTYTLEKSAGLPLYEQLYRRIKEDIQEGRLTSGEKLPSKRMLAENLKLSKITVENAYAQLAAEGYIRAEERRGYFVDVIDMPVKERESLPVTEEERETEEYFADFKTNYINTAHFPFSVWSRLMRQVMQDYSTRLLQVEPWGGVYALRKALCEYLYSFRGMRVSPEQIIIGAGTEQLYTLIVQYIGHGAVYAVEDPGYGKIARVYSAGGGRVRYLPMDGSGVSIGALRESCADVLHISPSHHFPTGTVTPQRRRQEILRWAMEREGRYIIEDDYDSEFRFTGRPIQTMQSTDRHGRVIYVNTFSKTIAPSIRVGYMVLPPELLEKFREKLGFYSCPVPSFEQYTLAAFIKKGYFEKHISRMKRRYRVQRDRVIGALMQSRLRDRAEILEADSGLHFLLRVDTEKTDAQIAAACAVRGVRVSCLSEYYSQREDGREHCLVLNYSGIEEENIERAVKVLEQVL